MNEQSINRPLSVTILVLIVSALALVGMFSPMIFHHRQPPLPCYRVAGYDTRFGSFLLWKERTLTSNTFGVCAEMHFNEKPDVEGFDWAVEIHRKDTPINAATRSHVQEGLFTDKDMAEDWAEHYCPTK